MDNYKQILQENKNIILRNIEQGKASGINKVSAVFASNKNDKQRADMITDIATWLINEGYKVSIKKDELQILIIEWD